MAEVFDIIDSNTIVMYPFRFGSSDKLVHLTQQQLDSIPYLAALVAHKDDMSSIQNENSEYVLNSPIHYKWFIIILRSIILEQPYVLFNDLPEGDNVLDTLQLFDYLCIKSFPLPLLQDENLMQSNSTNVEDSKTTIKYHKANLSEARQSAAEFIIALSKNEYNLDDSHTTNRIFFLIKVILSNVAIFSSRFRHHTLVITKECCHSFFSIKQQNLLPTIQQIAQHSKDESFMYLYDDETSLPDDFHNAFAWKGVYVPIEENRTDSLSINSNNTSSTNIFETFHDLDDEQMQLILSPSFQLPLIDVAYTFLLSHYDEYFCLYTPDATELPIYKAKQNQKKNETQSARSGRLNTLPKRPDVDKFKHRFGPKTQKYR